jgi:hypothetical protein
MAQTPFRQFYCLVLEDMQLQAVLRDITEQATFISRVVALGEEHGYHFTGEDVLMAMQAKRRAWIERRIG